MDQKNHYANIILGAGPGGLQMGYFFKKLGLDYLILDKASEVGSFFRKFPIGRKLISFNVARKGEDPYFAMRSDWNSFNQRDSENPVWFPEFDSDELPSAESLVKYFEAFHSRHILNTQLNTEISKISKHDDQFELHAENDRIYHCSNLYVATGYNKNKTPSFDGVEHCLTYWESDFKRDQFLNKSVLIIGKGNSALELADYLQGCTSSTSIVSPNPIKEATHTRYVGHVRRTHGMIFDKNMLKVGSSIFNANVKCVTPAHNGVGYNVTLDYTYDPRIIEKYFDYVILATGFRFDETIFDESCTPELCNGSKFMAQTPEYESTNVPNLFALGAQMHALDFNKAAGGFIHGFRWSEEFLAKLILKKQTGTDLAFTYFLSDQATELFKHVIERLSYSPELFQMNAVFGDFIVKVDGGYKYYESFPVAYVTNGLLVDLQHNEFLQITLENGIDVLNPFDPKTRNKSNMEKLSASDSFFIHPVVRHYKNLECVNQFELLEDEDNSWGQEYYTRPFIEFLNKGFTKTSPIVPDTYDLVPKSNYYQKAARIVGVSK